MNLWKDNFHDSDTYIQLVFDSFFDNGYIEYELSGDEVISALLGIPYTFGKEGNSIKGLYLFGLSTKHKYRGKGFMSKLLDRINDRAREDGFSFTFLIPASKRLRQYYLRRGYVYAFYRCQQNYTSAHDFKLEYEHILEEQKETVAELKRHYFDSLECHEYKQDGDSAIREGIKSIMRLEEGSRQDLEIIHSPEDIDLVIIENGISGDKIYYSITQEGVVTAVAFLTQGGHSRMDILRIYSTDLCSRYHLLDFIKRKYPEFSLRLYIIPRESERKHLSEIYGMAKILDLREVLKFQARGYGDLKYSILVKNPNDDSVYKFEVIGENVKRKNYHLNQEGNDNGKTVISHRDLSNVLFRRPDSGGLITEAFGMPSLGGYISLMLD